MDTIHVLRAWNHILHGRAPSLSVEITRECPLSCPGCYAYEPDHLGNGAALRDLTDRRGEELVSGVLDVVDRHKPLHLSIVGGDPLVRYRELEALLPQLLARKIHVQIVTSAFRVIPPEWKNWPLLTTVVSVDGLPADHDVRRSPATYERILRNISDSRITVHCTITRAMTRHSGYLAEFLDFWSARPEVRKIWFSLFTPQRGDVLPEILSSEDRRQVVQELLKLRRHYSKLDMPERLIREFSRPPASPEDCIFARTTETISADLTSRVTPCQFGGDPDCAQCGCFASMGLAAIGHYRVGGLIEVGSLFRVSARIGLAMASRPTVPAAAEPSVFPIFR